jgi:release factor glutamine methyltransferase
MKIRDVFTLKAARNLPRSEIRLLLAHVLLCTQSWLIAHDDEILSERNIALIQSLVSRRTQGEPIAYLIGSREFYGRNFRCSPAALIPRPETEMLIDQIIAMTRANVPNLAPSERAVGEDTLCILDIGTGTGCIGITLALELPRANITAIDVSTDALTLARENAALLNATEIEFVQSNWFASLGDEARFDVIVSNPPYIAPGDMHLSQGDLRFEPNIALADAVDGLESYRQLARGARKHLRAGCTLIVEHGYHQGESVPALFRDAGFIDVEMIRDLANQPRVTQCKIPPPA